MRTKPASLMESTRAGTNSSNLDVQIRPMKLLDCAIRTASLMDMSVRPQLAIMLGSSEFSVVGGATPSSLQSRTGSVNC